MKAATLFDAVPDMRRVVLHAEPVLTWPSLDPHHLAAVRRSSDTAARTCTQPPLALGGHGLGTIGPGIRCVLCHETASDVTGLSKWCAGATRALAAGGVE